MIIVPTPPSVAASVVTKASKRPPSPSSSIVLAKHERSNSCSASDKSSVVYVCAKKKNKTRTHKKAKNKKSELLYLVSAVDSGIDDKVTVVKGQSKVVAEGDDENSCDKEENMSNLSQNLLEDNDDE
jgi:hypothetical protein